MVGDQLPDRLRKLPNAPTPDHFRLTRSDREIESEPFLETLSIYRYLPQFRDEKRLENRKHNSSSETEDTT